MHPLEQMTDKDTQAQTSSSMKFIFSKIPVHNALREKIKPFICPNNSECNYSNASAYSDINIKGSPEDPSAIPTAIPPATRKDYSHPFTAKFIMASGITKGCRVPKGHHGVAKVAKFRIVDAKGKFVKENLNIKEKFKKIDGPDEIFKKLVPNNYKATNSYFDDCYRIFSPKALPFFTLKVEQNHLRDGEVISKNHIIFSPSNILICVFPRVGNGFGSKCKLF
jgi:hypothetical protein